MAGYGFGEELATIRRRNGLSVQEVSEALRIRPDIIRAIESENFSRMPAKGFARNQVSAYARYLALDPAEYTQRFIQAYNDFERAAANVDYVTDYQQPANDRAYATARKAARANEQSARQHGLRHGGSRSNGQRSSRNGGRGEGQRESTAIRRAHDATRDSNKTRYASPRRGGHGRRAGDKDIGSKGFNPGGSQLPLKKIAIGIIALIVIIIIATSVSHCGSKSTTDTTTTTDTAATTTTDGQQAASGDAIQVTGGTASDAAVMTDTSGNALTAMPDIKATANSISIKVTLESGASSWVQIDTDGATPVAEEAVGPQEYTETATSSAVITIGNADAAKVTINGTEANVETGSDGLGYVYVKIEDGKLVFGDAAKPKSSSSSDGESGSDSNSSDSSSSSDGSEYVDDEYYLDEDQDGYNDFTGEPM
ncbi:MAG: RodZ domain-containing protein [Coriobacteriales bacterium]|jgi:cytoskeleton protein RodZ